MIIHYFKIAYRQLFRNKLNTVINLTGLSVGIASCILIFLFVNNEMKYDKFHSNADHIYRISSHENSEGNFRDFGNTFMPYAPLLQDNLREIEYTVRLLPQSVSVENEYNNVFQEPNFFYVDSTFFELFTFPLSRGDSKTALNDPNNIIITEKIASKYFGNSNPMGKQLKIEGGHLFKVSGVFKDIPNQSSLNFDFIVPITAANKIWGSWINSPNRTWYYPPVYSFAKLSPTSSIKELENKISSFDKTHTPEHVSSVRTHRFQNIRDIHFSNLENELSPTINKGTLKIFVIIGIVTLIIAAFNFINLFLAKIIVQLKSMGIKMVFGAGKSHIWKQTLTDSLLHVTISLGLAILFCVLFLPTFNNIMNLNLKLFADENSSIWLLVLGLCLIMALLISIAPYIMAVKSKLVGILKERSTRLINGKNVVSTQSILIVIQFFIAVVLIISTIVIQSQMNFIKNKNLGLNTERLITIPVRDEIIQEKYELLKNNLSEIGGVENVAAISNFPWVKGYYDFDTTIKNQGKESKSSIPTLLVDNNFIKTMDMEVVKGRDFSKRFGTDSTNAFIINETAAVKFGVNDIDNISISMENVAAGDPKTGKVIGIVKDFHLQSLHKPIEPLILTIAPQSYYIDNIVIKVSSNDIATAISNIEDSFKSIAPNRPFDYFFLDEAFNNLYQNEAKVSRLFNYFSLIAIFIASLGLLGIIAFNAARRVKEIGIRKVLGASVFNIVFLLTKNFIKLVLMAFLIAAPFAYYFMNKWLQSFSYKIEINWQIFVLAGIFSLLIALVTVIYQTIKAATANPTNSIRTE